MVTQGRAQPTPITPVEPQPRANERLKVFSRAIARVGDSRPVISLTNLGSQIDFPRWLRQKSKLPAWQVALTAALILIASALVPQLAHRHQAPSGVTTSSVQAPTVSDSLPVDLPVPFNGAQVQQPPTGDSTAGQQIAGLESSSQEILKQIEQAQRDYAALRDQVRAQDQSLGATQSEAAASDAERATQRQQLQRQTSAVISTASDRLNTLNQSVTALDSQANLLRKSLGMGQGNYPAVTVPNLAASADPAQAFAAALTTIDAHISAVTTDLQSLKATAQSQLAFAQSVNVQPVGAGTSVHGTGQLSWPTTGTITQSYGPTSLTLEPAYGGYDHFHLGVDIANSQGTPIAAAAAGTIIFAGWTDAGYGNMVEIDHGNGLVTIYGHMMATPSVTTGQHVFKGQLIGYMGTTGNSTGPHLHFGVQYNGSWANPFTFLP